MCVAICLITNYIWRSVLVYRLLMVSPQMEWTFEFRFDMNFDCATVFWRHGNSSQSCGVTRVHPNNMSGIDRLADLLCWLADWHSIPDSFATMCRHDWCVCLRRGIQGHASWYVTIAIAPTQSVQPANCVWHCHRWSRARSVGNVRCVPSATKWLR